MIKYPYSRPSVTEEDIRCVVEAATSQFLTQGPRVDEFERALSEVMGAQHAIVCNSGTAALHMIYKSLDVGPKRGLITTPITFLATANAARMCNAPVAFCDVDPETGLMTPEALEHTFSTVDFEVGVVAPIHLGGRVADLSSLSEIADAHGAVLVDDACHAPGASYLSNGERRMVGDGIGTLASAFSFHAIKHLTMGEGGAVLTNDDRIAERARLYRSHGIVRTSSEWQNAPEENAPWYYEMHELGYNYRADELACSLGLSQLARLGTSLQKRRALVELYGSLLSDIPHLTTPRVPTDPSEHAWHLYPVAIDFDATGMSRGTVMIRLAERGVGSQVHYIPLYRQPYYKGPAASTFPGAERYYQRTLSLPMHLEISPANAEEISHIVREVLAS